jgi:hypothetical protein
MHWIWSSFANLWKTLSLVVSAMGRLVTILPCLTVHQFICFKCSNNISFFRDYKWILQSKSYLLPVVSYCFLMLPLYPPVSATSTSFWKELCCVLERRKLLVKIEYMLTQWFSPDDSAILQLKYALESKVSLQFISTHFKEQGRLCKINICLATQEVSCLL